MLKLINNSNFGYNCPDNIYNCTFAPINSKLDEISYLKKYQSSFDKEMSDFVSCELLQKGIEAELH